MIELPIKKREPLRSLPKTLLLYGVPKVGKTKFITTLENALILDMEEGSHSYACTAADIKSTAQLDSVMESILSYGKASGGQYPYKYIVVDTVDRLEDYIEVLCTKIYKGSTVGKDFQGDSVQELAYGAGYKMIRDKMVYYIEKLSKLCEHLIVISHVRDKTLMKEGIEVSVKDLSLAGKLGSILMAKMDAIGFMYRQNADLMVSFNTGQSAVMGSRYEHLAGKILLADWELLFPTQK